MEKPLIDTEIDDLLKVLLEKETISLDEASKLMKVEQKTMQVWVDSLVEEKVINLDYDFLTPIIKLTPHIKKEFLEKKKNLEMQEKETIAKKLGLKGTFYQKAKLRKIDERKIPILWTQYVRINETSIKKEFMEKANKKMIEGNMEKIWLKFIKQYESQEPQKI